MKHLISFLFLTLPLAAMAQSPVGAASSDRANEVATNTQKPTIEYANAGQEGPRIVVAPGDIKSANASFTKKVTANAIADFGEVELNRANFKITKNIFDEEQKELRKKLLTLIESLEQEELKQETLEEAAKEFVLSHDFSRLTNPNHLANRCFQYGAKWQQEQDSWKSVSEETPPTSVELLVKSPNGVIYLSSWRESYQIFCCQDKSESSSDWKWKTI
jgi:hypothetical protein